MNYVPELEEGIGKPECELIGAEGGDDTGRQVKYWDNSNNRKSFDKIGLAPNPTTGEVLISLPQSYDGNGISILDIYGRVVQKIESIQTNQSVNLSRSKSGVYIFIISDKTGKIITEKLLLQK